MEGLLGSTDIHTAHSLIHPFADHCSIGLGSQSRLGWHPEVSRMQIGAWQASPKDGTAQHPSSVLLELLPHCAILCMCLTFLISSRTSSYWTKGVLEPWNSRPHHVGLLAPYEDSRASIDPFARWQGVAESGRRVKGAATTRACCWYNSRSTTRRTVVVCITRAPSKCSPPSLNLHPSLEADTFHPPNHPQRQPASLIHPLKARAFVSFFVSLGDVFSSTWPRPSFNPCRKYPPLLPYLAEPGH